MRNPAESFQMSPPAAHAVASIRQSPATTDAAGGKSRQGCLSHRQRHKAGYTLVEVIVASAISIVAISGVIGSWMFSARSTFTLANYVTMNSMGRTGLEIFARDVRNARSISNFSQTGMTFQMEGGATVRYFRDTTARTLVRDSGGTRRVIFRNIEELIFTRFNVLREPALNDLETKQIQIELRMVQPVLARGTSQKIVSARYIMRNKRVSI